ncbi:MAG TPA: DUF1569 domain-containing protein [Gemmataceae bacterium]|jgi:hypothetical protein
MAVATKSVTGRRHLHFDTLDDILADVEQLNWGPIKNLGNWSPGQVLKHLTILMTGSLDGFHHRAPWFIRLVGKVVKKRFLTKPMSAGFQLPKAPAAEFVPGPIEWADALPQFREAVRRLKAEEKREPSPFLGPMTRQEWDQLHCRHAELHLSFLVPG